MLRAPPDKLTAQICTEVLYQPLTLIDCLHSFCGSCLKEWFAWQHTRATQSQSPPSSSSNPYTCPSCRASVKDARHNAQVSTLLGMFLTAFPQRGKSAEEKEEMAKAYKPGENMLLRVEPQRRSERRARRQEAEEAEERRLVEEVRERSMREMGGRSGQRSDSLDVPTAPRGSSRSQSRDTTEREERRERRREHERRERRRRADAEQAEYARENATLASPPRITLPTTSPRHPVQVEARLRDVQLAHQSSLRSLMSGSESGTGTGDSLNEERIMQQILDEGLLEGIDLHNLDRGQEDQLSERIAEAYRQRHHGINQRSLPQASRTTSRDGGSTNERIRVRERQEQAERRHHHRSRSAHESTAIEVRRPVHQAESRHPPLSRPYLLDGSDSHGQSSTPRDRRRRDPDHNRPSSSRSRRSIQDEAGRSQASWSATDLTDRPRSGETTRAQRPRHPSDSRRTHTEPEQSAGISETRLEGSVERHRAQAIQTPQVDSPTHVSREGEIGPAPTQPANAANRQHTRVTSEAQLAASRSGAFSPTIASSTSQSSPFHPTSPAGEQSTTYQESAISCSRCGRPNIQYDLHKHCSKCAMNLCLRCYREKRGCNHWFGFGSTAQTNFDNSQPRRASRIMEQPHVLVGRKYLRPSPSIKTESRADGTSENAAAVMAVSDPATRLQEGKFCDRCHTFADTCFWSCDCCNEGEWGFCNNCVNSHHCCTHPLLPIAHQSSGPSRQNQKSQATNGSPTRDFVLTSSERNAGVQSHPSGEGTSSTADSSQNPFPYEPTDYRPLTITTNCDICSTPIPPDHTRFQCPRHPTPTPNDPDSKGDYDMCMNCYFNLVKIGQIKRENGPAGWRKCLQGHRMIVVGFEEWPEGQRRIVVNDLTGGHKMTDDDVANFNLSSFSNPSAASSSSSYPNPPPVASATTGATAGRWSWKEDAAGTKRASRVRTSSFTHTSKFPPDGGYGKTSVALWSHYPEEGESGKGELLFPRGAEINEVEEINEEWYFGVYMGDLGLLPAQYVRVCSA